MSEITERANELRQIAKGCATVTDLARKLKWNQESARAANEQLSLGLGDVKLNRGGAPREGMAVPKPTKAKSGGAK